MEIRSVALLGLGTMGAGMAKNLLKHGYSLTIYNRTREKAEPFAGKGATIADTPAKAVDGAQVIIAMLADDHASRQVWLGENGALAAAPGGAILIESSTVSPKWIGELAQQASMRELQLLDAPVTGSRLQAEERQLVFLVGGPEESLSTVSPVLNAIGKDIVHLGPVGSGARMKLVNNFLCGVQATSLAEAITWIERCGLNCEQALNVLNNGAPGSPLLRALSSRMTARDYTVNFLLRLMEKDLKYAIDEASAFQVSLATATSAAEQFHHAVEHGYGDQDMSAIIEMLRKSSK